MTDGAQRARRLVADAVVRAAAGHHKVLLAGLVNGDGASTVMRMVREFHPGSTSLVECPPLGEGEGFAGLDAATLEGAGGLVLVVRAEHTPRPAITQVVDWARARQLELLGVVWNDGPPAAPALAGLRGWFKRLVRRTPREVAT